MSHFGDGVRFWSTLPYLIERSVTAINTVLIGMTVGALLILQIPRAASTRLSTSRATVE